MPSRVSSPLHLALLLIFAVWTSTAQQTISDSVRITSDGGSLGYPDDTTTIEAGVEFWLSGASPHYVYGTIENSGTIVLSQSDTSDNTTGLRNYWRASSNDNCALVNGPKALFQVNDIASTGTPRYYWLLNTLDNKGVIQWCSSQAPVGRPFRFSCNSTECSNNGLMIFEQDSAMTVGASLGNYQPQPNDEPQLQEFYQNGAVLLRNTYLDLIQNFRGSGCWIIGFNSTLHLNDGVATYQNPNYTAPLESQSIYFIDSTASLNISHAVYATGNGTFGANVYGFGPGNTFLFDDVATEANYDSSSGVLTIVFANTNATMLIHVGGGYYYLYWFADTLESGSRVYYPFNPSTLDSAPDVCFMSADPCVAEPPVTTTTEAYSGVSTTTSYGTGEDFGTVFVFTPTAASTTVKTTTTTSSLSSTVTSTTITTMTSSSISSNTTDSESSTVSSNPTTTTITSDSSTASSSPAMTRTNSYPSTLPSLSITTTINSDSSTVSSNNITTTTTNSGSSTVYSNTTTTTTNSDSSTVSSNTTTMTTNNLSSTLPSTATTDVPATTTGSSSAPLFTETLSSVSSESSTKGSATRSRTRRFSTPRSRTSAPTTSPQPTSQPASTCGPNAAATPCPVCDNQVLTDINDNPYKVNCNASYTGQPLEVSVALKRAPVPDEGTIPACLQLCDNTPECVAASFNMTARTCTMFSCLATLVRSTDSVGFYRSDMQSAIACVQNTTVTTSTVTITTCRAPFSQSTTTLHETATITSCSGETTCIAPGMRRLLY